MEIIKCPKCGKEVKIDIANSISDDGEVFQCPYCKYQFRYVEK